jgi:predicted nucleotidyltransferase
MALREDLHHHRDAVLAIAARHGASNLCLFGSAVRGEERPDSDVDLLVDIAEDRGFGDYLELVEELERLLARRVDIVTRRSLSPHFRPFIETEAHPL